MSKQKYDIAVLVEKIRYCGFAEKYGFVVLAGNMIFNFGMKYNFCGFDGQITVFYKIIVKYYLKFCTQTYYLDN